MNNAQPASSYSLFEQDIIAKSQAGIGMLMLELKEVAIPEVKPVAVLVRVMASAINR